MFPMGHFLGEMSRVLCHHAIGNRPCRLSSTKDTSLTHSALRAVGSFCKLTHLHTSQRIQRAVMLTAGCRMHVPCGKVRPQLTTAAHPCRRKPYPYSCTLGVVAVGQLLAATCTCLRLVECARDVSAQRTSTGKRVAVSSRVAPTGMLQNTVQERGREV